MDIEQKQQLLTEWLGNPKHDVADKAMEVLKVCWEKIEANRSTGLLDALAYLIEDSGMQLREAAYAAYKLGQMIESGEFQMLGVLKGLGGLLEELRNQHE